MSDDTRELSTSDEIRSYFDQFSGIILQLALIAMKERETAVRDGYENDIVLGYLKALSETLRALGMKYAYAGHVKHRLPNELEIDDTDSGFPTYKEIAQLEIDQREALGADEPEEGPLRAEILDHVLREKTVPRELQFRESQRLYREILRKGDGGGLFLPRMRPVLASERELKDGNRQYLVHWAVYDAQRNHPVVYIMALDDSGDRPLAKDRERLEALCRVLLNQSVSSLKLVTIATETDKEFADLHPKRLKRIFVGPMYSARFTRLNAAIGSVLSGFAGDPRQDWVFSWMTETLRSKGSKRVKTGMFGERLMETYDIDLSDYQASESGVTESSRRVIMPYGAFQVLSGLPDNPLNSIPKYVIGNNGHVAFHL